MKDGVLDDKVELVSGLSSASEEEDSTMAVTRRPSNTTCTTAFQNQKMQELMMSSAYNDKEAQIKGFEVESFVPGSRRGSIMEESGVP